MSTVSSSTKRSAPILSSFWKSDTLRGILVGLIPLGLLTGMVALALVLTALVRLLFASAGFLVWQQAAVIVLIAGLLLALALYGLAIWRVLRQVMAWQGVGEQGQARAALWSLGATALIVIVPVLLAALSPQHPAP